LKDNCKAADKDNGAVGKEDFKKFENIENVKV